MWRPIETAPKDGTAILGYDGTSIQAICWKGGRWVTDWDHDPRYEEDGPATHWQPLPERPAD